MNLSFVLSPDARQQYIRLNGQERASVKRLMDLIRLLPFNGARYNTDNEGLDWYAHYGHDLFVVYRVEGFTCRIAAILPWAGMDFD